MNKISISVGKEYLSFSKYNRSTNEENLNNTNIIDVKNLKFTEEYVLENCDVTQPLVLSEHVAVIVLDCVEELLLIHVVLPPLTAHLGGVSSIFIITTLEYSEQFPSLSHALY